MDSMRVLDQHIDRSQLRIEPSEAAKYQFIWDFSPRPKTCGGTAQHGRRPREDDERTLTSVMTESRRSHKKCVEVERGGGGGFLSVVLRGVKDSRRQMKKLLQHKDRTPAPVVAATEKSHDGLRRSSEATLVEKIASQTEKGAMKK